MRDYERDYDGCQANKAWAEQQLGSPPPGPWLAWSATRWSPNNSPPDHGTLDGKETLCGIPVSGSDRLISFPTPTACQRCAKALTRKA